MMIVNVFIIIPFIQPMISSFITYLIPVVSTVSGVVLLMPT